MGGASQSTGPLRSGSLGLWPIRGWISVRGGLSQVVRVTTEGGGSQYHESRVPYSSEDTILLDSMRPRTIRTRSCYNRTSELCHH